KARPGALNYGAAGTQNQLAFELLKLRTGVSIVHVPYRGASLVLNDLISGQVQLAFSSTLAVLGHLKSGRLRALAATSARRAADRRGLGVSGLRREARDGGPRPRRRAGDYPRPSERGHRERRQITRSPQQAGR